MISPFLAEAPRRVHRLWWTCLPAIPSSPLSPGYHRLRRVWFDHTMNTFKQLSDSTWRPNARGFYTEGTEDHVTPILFETFSVLPETLWVPALLSRMGISVDGSIKRANWCYSFEQAYEGRKFCIADIVLAWEDNAGQAVLVIEAKMPGVGLTSKDLPTTAPYLKMSSICSIKRRHYRLLIDERDRLNTESLMPAGAPNLTWQDLASVQIAAAQLMAVSTEIRDRFTSTIEWLFIHHKVMSPSAYSPNPSYQGTIDEYARIRSEGLDRKLTEFFVGAACCGSALRGVMPEPPYDYLGAEPVALDVYRSGKQRTPGSQTTLDRRVEHWRLL